MELVREKNQTLEKVIIVVKLNVQIYYLIMTLWQELRLSSVCCRVWERLDQLHCCATDIFGIATGTTAVL